MLQSERLFLIPTNLPLLESIVEGQNADLSALLGGVDMAEGWLHFPEAIVWMRDYLRENSAELGWWNYLIVHQQDARLIGTCGFKGPPDYEACVEIGYELAPAYQGKGLAKETAQRLCDFAFGHEAVEKVKAQTLAEENPSVGVLRALGFAFMGEYVDIEDGKLWEFEKKKGS